MDRLDFIDTRFGTANHYHFSQGNCLPLTGVPFGMHYLSVETSQDRGAWWFHPDDHSFSGIRLTHQPSPWVGDFATVTFLPVSGPLTKGDVFHNQTSYRPKEAVFQPHLLEIFSQRHRILTRATAATYSFHCDFSFDNGKAGLIIHNLGKSSWQVTADGKTVLGCVQNITDCRDKDLTMFVYLQFSSPVLKKLIGEDLSPKSLEDCSKTSFTYLQFADDLKHLELRAATSFISFDQAQLNWQRDFPRSFEKSLEHSRKEWLSYLNRIDIKDKDFDKVKTYYQHFYRALLFPQRWYEITAAGQAIHYNTSCQEPVAGKYYTNNGFWDTYKSVYPLLSLIAPEIYADILEGLLSAYQDTGYLPNSYQESVNQTQDYAYSDFCIGQVAATLGQTQLSSQYHTRSLNYRHLVDTHTGYLNSKDRQGQWRCDFNPIHWGQDYTEGSYYQNGFAFYHDILGYIRLIGGKAAFAKRLEELCNHEPVFDVHSYGFEIHEMSELAAQDFGQIAISNQPSFHLPYLYHYIGQPQYGQLILKNLLSHAFTDTGYPGDEDNGSMSAWYLLNSLGLYSVTPGTGQYLIGIPTVDQATLYLPNGNTIQISCQGNVPQYQFVKELKLNQASYSKLYINHDDLIQGCQLDFQLGLVPPLKHYSAEELPYSLTR